MYCLTIFYTAKLRIWLYNFITLLYMPVDFPSKVIFIFGYVMFDVVLFIACIECFYVFNILVGGLIIVFGVTKGCVHIICYRTDIPLVENPSPQVEARRINVQQRIIIPMLPLVRLHPINSATTIHSPLHGGNQTSFDNLEPDYECSICLSPKKKGLVTVLCMHIFHKQCINEWVKFDKTCPICRADMLTGQHTNIVV